MGIGLIEVILVTTTVIICVLYVEQEKRIRQELKCVIVGTAEHGWTKNVTTITLSNIYDILLCC